MIIFTYPSQTIAVDTSLLAKETTLGSINSKTPALGQAVMASSSPVVIASNQSAVPVSAASLPLPTGAATETTLAAINTKLPALGQAAMAASQPVVIANNQSTIPSNISQINAVTPLMGAGPTGTGSMRQTIANAATPTSANVAASITNVTLLASSATRMGAAFYNDSSSAMYLKLGATSSTTSFTVKLVAGAYYEIPGPHIYSGIVDGIWDTATGTCRITSW